MYKLIGIFMVLSAFAVFAINKVQTIKGKTDNLNEMKKAVTYIRDELCFSVPELSVLCKKVSSQTQGDVSLMFKDVADLMSDGENTDFYTAFKSATNEKTLFSDDGMKVATEFSKNLGKKNLEIEIKNLQNTETALQRLIQAEEEKGKNDTKLIYTLSAAAAMAFVILTI